jgi:NADH dehydrogenase (ubiquinone) Fe-S protein 1
MNRCIHCTRCVRFSEEIAGVSDLGTTGRGKATEIGTYVDKMMTSELSGNIVDLCPVGALTNGPYAFTSRPWELKSTNSIDLLEPLCPNVIFDRRGPEIMRSLPRVNEDVNEEWLADKSRYSYDGLKRQRLDSPMVRNLETGKYQEISWVQAFEMLAERMGSVTSPASEILGLVGEFNSLETLTLFKDMLAKFDNEQVAWNIYGEERSTVRENFLLNTEVTDLSEADAIVLIGSNLKYESPLLNARILKGTRKLKNKTKVYTLGPDHDLGYKTIHLGTNVSVVDQIVNGTHPLSQKLANAQNAKIIISGLQADSLPEYSLLTNKLRQFTNQLNEASGQKKVSFGILNGYVGWINAQELGLENWGLAKNNASLGHMKLIYNLGNDNSRFLNYLQNRINEADSEYRPFVVYQGSHGDVGASFADLILPSAAFTEERGTFSNVEGRIQMANKVVGPPGDARENWQILRAVSEVMGMNLFMDDWEEVNLRMSQILPYTVKKDFKEQWHSLQVDVPGILSNIANF